MKRFVDNEGYVFYAEVLRNTRTEKGSRYVILKANALCKEIWVKADYNESGEDLFPGDVVSFSLFPRYYKKDDKITPYLGFTILSVLKHLADVPVNDDSDEDDIPS